MTNLSLQASGGAVSPRDKFEEFLRTKSMRLTQERSLILDEVFSSHEHFDAEQLIERFSSVKGKRGPSRATIYRNLQLMEEAGLLRKVARPNGRDVYEHDYGYPQHDHFICNQCQKMIEFSNQSITEFLEKLAEEHGFLLDSHRLEAFGICDDCRKPARRNSKLNLL